MLDTSAVYVETRVQGSRKRQLQNERISVTPEIPASEILSSEVSILGDAYFK
jgi:hypothetical protein